MHKIYFSVTILCFQFCSKGLGEFTHNIISPLSLSEAESYNLQGVRSRQNNQPRVV